MLECGGLTDHCPFSDFLVFDSSIPSATLYFSQNGSTWWSPVGGPVFGLSSSHTSPIREEQRQEGVAGQDMGACTPLPQPLGSLLPVPSGLVLQLDGLPWLCCPRLRREAKVSFPRLLSAQRTGVETAQQSSWFSLHFPFSTRCPTSFWTRPAAFRSD